MELFSFHHGVQRMRLGNPHAVIPEGSSAQTVQSPKEFALAILGSCKYFLPSSWHQRVMVVVVILF